MNVANQFFIGIDLGGTSVRVGLFNSGSSLIDSLSFRTRVADGPDETVLKMAGAVRKLATRHGVTVRAAGIGSPGPLNLADGTLLQLPNFPGWENFPIRDRLAGEIDCAVSIESDANVAALAESLYGAGKEHAVDSLVMWTLGTGVGGGIIFQSQIWRGCNDMAGEIGHISVDPQGGSCPCGGQGCLELYASATAIRSAGQEWFQRNHRDTACTDIEALTPRFMADLADRGHSGMRAIFREVGFKLGLSVSQTINTLDVPLYIIGGGVARAWHLFSPSMLETVARYSYVYRLGQTARKKPVIAPAVLGPNAGLVGAALVADGSCGERRNQDQMR